MNSSDSESDSPIPDRLVAIRRLKQIREEKARKLQAQMKYEALNRKCVVILKASDRIDMSLMDPSQFPSTSQTEIGEMPSKNDMNELVEYLKQKDRDENVAEVVHRWDAPYPLFEYISPPPWPTIDPTLFSDITSEDDDDNPNEAPSPILSKLEYVSSSESMFSPISELQEKPQIIDLTESPPANQLSFFGPPSVSSPKVMAIVKPFNFNVDVPTTSADSANQIQSTDDLAQDIKLEPNVDRLQALKDKANQLIMQANSQHATAESISSNAHDSSASQLRYEPETEAISSLNTSADDSDDDTATIKEFNRQIGKVWVQDIQDITPTSSLHSEDGDDTSSCDFEALLDSSDPEEEEEEGGEKDVLDGPEDALSREEAIKFKIEQLERKKRQMERDLEMEMEKHRKKPTEKMLEQRKLWEARKERENAQKEQMTPPFKMPRLEDVGTTEQDNDEKLQRFLENKKKETLEKSKELGNFVPPKILGHRDSVNMYVPKAKQSLKGKPVAGSTFYAKTIASSGSGQAESSGTSSSETNTTTNTGNKSEVPSKERHDESSSDPMDKLRMQVQLRQAKKIKNQAISRASPKINRDIPKPDPQSLFVRKPLHVPKKYSHTFESPLSQMLGPAPGTAATALKTGQTAAKPTATAACSDQNANSNTTAVSTRLAPVPWHKQDSFEKPAVDPQSLFAKGAIATESNSYEAGGLLSQILGPEQPEKVVPLSEKPGPLKRQSSDLISNLPPAKRRKPEDIKLYKPNHDLVCEKSCLRVTTDQATTSKNVAVQKKPKVTFARDPVTSRWEPLVEDCSNSPEVGGKHTEQSVNTSKLRDIVDAAILRWTPNWLQEYDTKNLPEILEDMSILQSPHRSAPMKFLTYEEYRDRFVPLLLMEIWETVFNDNKQFCKQRPSSFEVMPSKAPNPDDVFRKLRIGRVVCTEDFLNLAEDDLLVIEMENSKCPFFAVVENEQTKFKVSAQCPTYLKSCVDKLKREDRSIYPKLHIEQYDVKLKNKTVLNKDLGGVASVRIVSKLRPSLRLVGGLAEVEGSHLMPILQHPSSDGHQLPSCDADQVLVQHKNLNESQQEVVRCISNDVLFNRKEPKIALVHGPPGTGKSRTILAILQQMHQMRKAMDVGLQHEEPLGPVLLCAPSNGAVDELSRNIIRHNESVKEGHPDYMNFLRVGSEQIADDVKRYSLDNLAKQNVSREGYVRQKMHERAEALRRIQQLCDSTGRPKPSYRHVIETLYKDIEKLDMEIRGTATKELRKSLIEHAYIIAVTLNSCGVSALENLKPCCVIIDEACQSTELETLIPLQFGSVKLILVGDPEQLPPTVISKFAQDRHFGESLFERCRRCLLREEREDCIKFLNEQYRMVQHIAQFPSKRVYKDRLKTARNVKSPSTFNLEPYKVFNLQYSKEQRQAAGGTSVYNSSEAEIIVQMCSMIMAETGLTGVDMGVITFYKAQVGCIDQALKEHESLRQVEVNTVDGFQGREKCVIILSCVRASGIVGFLRDRRRMNVSITRAKFGMYVVGNLTTLKKDANWRSLVTDAYSRRQVVVVNNRTKSCVKAALRELMKTDSQNQV